jgi:hypothetical protein
MGSDGAVGVVGSRKERNMRLRRVLSVVLTLAAVTVAAADRPYLGKWKMNAAKSDLGEPTVTYEQLP